MKVTLRKANAIQQSINETINSLDLSTDISITEFETAKDLLKDNIDRFFKNYKTRETLTEILYEIRKAVAQKNSSSGIDNLLADVAHLDKTISYLKNLAFKQEALGLKVINGKLNKISQRDTADVYGRFGDDTVHTSIFNKEQLDQFKSHLAEAKKKKAAIQDSLLELNIQTTIKLSDEAVKTLSDLEIL